MRKMLLCLAAALLLGTLPAAALTQAPYATYTYSVEGEAQESPHAYIPASSFSSAEGMEGRLTEPSDLAADSQGRLYIADTGNNRVVILAPDGTFLAALSSFDNKGREDSLSGPKGVFAAGDGSLYVSDTGNERILRFSAGRALLAEVKKPRSPLLGEDYVFRPRTLVVDKSGRLFVSAENMNMGILVLDIDGNFKNFFGAQKAQINPIEMFWRRFMTDEQISRTESFIPTEYNSITMDADGFLFVTSSAIDPSQQLEATLSQNADTRYAPVKRFGASGVDVLRREGGFPPSGDVSVSLLEGRGPSAIVDCACGPFGTYTLLDSSRNKLFTYDSDGNLLFAFGGAGAQLGLFEGLGAAAYLPDGRLACLDTLHGTVTIFTRTEYGDLLYNVMQLHDERRYSEEIAVWKQVLLKNNNLDYAYTGLGRSLMKSGDYEEAMRLFKTASNRSYYSEAFGEARKETMSRWLLILPVVIAAVVVGVILLFSFMAKYNRRRTGKPGRRNLREQLAYGFYIIFHPFDGFWDLHHEGRGSGRAAAIIFLAACATMMLQSGASGYLYTGGGGLFAGPLILLCVLTLFTVSNWSITSLTNGKGTAAQVAAMSCYALVPLILLTLPQVALSHMLTLEEAAYMTALSTAGYVWTGLLLFAGIITIHQYTLPKALLTALLTVVGMVVIVILILMFFNLAERMVSFFSNYYREIFYRL